MTQSDWRPDPHPVPIIDPARCTGCGLCVAVCPTAALTMQGSLPVVAHPEACDYHGLCEMVCPEQAIARPFEIVGVDDADHQVPQETQPVAEK